MVGSFNKKSEVMSVPSQVATAYVQIVPSAQGIKKALEDILG